MTSHFKKFQTQVVQDKQGIWQKIQRSKEQLEKMRVHPEIRAYYQWGRVRGSICLGLMFGWLLTHPEHSYMGVYFQEWLMSNGLGTSQQFLERNNPVRWIMTDLDERAGRVAEWKSLSDTGVNSVGKLPRE
jgi:hypothetical protein